MSNKPTNSKYLRTVRKYMESMNYQLKRNKNHMVWYNNNTKSQIVFSKSPKNTVCSLKNMKFHVRKTKYG